MSPPKRGGSGCEKIKSSRKQINGMYQATTPKLEPPLKTCCTFNVVLISYFIDIL